MTNVNWIKFYVTFYLITDEKLVPRTLFQLFENVLFQVTHVIYISMFVHLSVCLCGGGKGMCKPQHIHVGQGIFATIIPLIPLCSSWELNPSHQTRHKEPLLSNYLTSCAFLDFKLC